MMKVSSVVFSGLVSFSLCVVTAAIAQPRYAPMVRAQREAEWMRDSLGVSATVAAKDSVISQRYNEAMDKAADTKPTTKAKKQKQLMRKKDADIKALLNNNSQYERYIRREKEVRRKESMIYTGPHQPR